jgi:copper chaperone CopZ
MCKKTIETALKDVKGIEKATWDVESKILTLSYDSSVIKLAEVGKIIAGVGYDNEMEKSDAETYAKLPDCCQYERK